MKRLICFSLWGDYQFYNLGALENIKEAKEVYPEWKCRFYVREDSPALNQLKANDCEVITMPMSSGKHCQGVLWRLSAASDPDVEYAIFRDCDSRVNTKEAAGVQAWINSGKKAHVIREVPAHRGYPMMAGMCGIKGGIIEDIDTMMALWVSKYTPFSKYASEEFLQAMVWPLLKNDTLVHGIDSPHGKGTPFPEHLPMKYGEYIGQVVFPYPPPYNLR
jgi:hypothetical protein